jgi:anhydro-N-acetylmuramic acid kinase
MSLTHRKPKALLVAGVMSGTSADGVDVALCRIAPGLEAGDTPRVKLIGHRATRYPKAVRAAVLRVMEGTALSAAEMSRLNWRMGEIYADCVAKAAAKFGVAVGLVGCHGQTVHHEATAVRFLGGRVRSTWQTGEAAAIAERLRCPVVSDFRPADLAAGGQGAPLVPMLDYCLFRSATKNRILLNLGGIANMTVIPAGARLKDLIAFDSGPANMVIDHCMERLFGRAFDKGGKVAARGRCIDSVIEALAAERYFAQQPPKSCGREQFGAGFAQRLREMCAAAGGSAEDAVATATQLTATTIVEAYLRFCKGLLGSGPTEVVVGGGGARNPSLMGLLRTSFQTRGAGVIATDKIGIPAQAKEAVAFALLAWLTWHGLPGNVPTATGASRPVVLGKVSFG